MHLELIYINSQHAAMFKPGVQVPCESFQGELKQMTIEIIGNVIIYLRY